MPIYALGDSEPDIHPDAYIHPQAVLIGTVSIGPESSVWAGAVLRGDDGAIRVGERTSVQDGAVLHCTPELDTWVGNECTIGHLAHLEGCEVRDGGLVGTAAVVLHQAVVGEWALVGANALVPGGMQIPPGALALGVPARIREAGADMDSIREGMLSYVERATRYRTELRRLD